MPAPDLVTAELTLTGRITTASNATFPGSIGDVTVVYKPIAGESPLRDFPHGTLAHRQAAAYLVSQASGWDVVPQTWLCDGQGDHIPAMTDGHRHGVDHGLTFHRDHKLPTVLWGWLGDAPTAEERDGIDPVSEGLHGGLGRTWRACPPSKKSHRSPRAVPGCAWPGGFLLRAVRCLRCLGRCSNSL